jgi:hypothetical protein
MKFPCKRLAAPKTTFTFSSSSRRSSLAKAVALLKANSSKWMGEQGHRFSWQEGYGAFSVSSSNLDRVIRYIQNQETHHRKTKFEDEFQGLLRKHGVEYDPEWVFG